MKFKFDKSKKYGDCCELNMKARTDVVGGIPYAISAGIQILEEQIQEMIPIRYRHKITWKASFCEGNQKKCFTEWQYKP